MKRTSKTVARRRAAPEFLPQTSPKWWSSALSELSDTGRLVLSALLSAMAVALTPIVIPVANGSIRVMFTYIVSSLNSMLVGPFVGLLWGAVTDLVGFVIFGDGAFFPGYTVTEMLVAFTFGLFLYRRPISFYRILAARAVINLFINAGLGSLWVVMMGWTSKGYPIQFGISLVKNMILLPIEAIVMTLVFTALTPSLVQMKLIPSGVKGRIKRTEVAVAVILALLIFASAAIVYYFVIYKK